MFELRVSADRAELLDLRRKKAWRFNETAAYIVRRSAEGASERSIVEGLRAGYHDLPPAEARAAVSALRDRLIRARVLVPQPSWTGASVQVTPLGAALGNVELSRAVIVRRPRSGEA